MNDGINTFYPEFIRKYHDLLNEIEDSEGSAALVTVSFHEKVFFAGMNLKKLSPLDSHDRFHFV